MRLGILGSTRGTNLIAIINAINQKQLNASIATVISNRVDALILEKAKACHIPAHFVDPRNIDREAYDHRISETLRQYHVDLVVLIGYMRILSAPFTHQWQQKMINVHPSLLPAFAGKMDLEVHKEVLLAGVEETGCTVHFVTEMVDAGPIVLQKKCPVLKGDTPEQLKIRVQALEGQALVEAINRLSRINN